MAEGFDPYFKWLGIPPDEQPPNHYRLLGVPLYIDDADVIENAADRQMSHVRTLQSGKNVKLTQQILNEISAAKLCLLDTKEQAAYDRTLRGSLDEANKPTRIVKPVDAPQQAATRNNGASPPRKAPVVATDRLPRAHATSQGARKSAAPLVAAVVVLLILAGAAVGIYLALFRDDARSKVVGGNVARPAKLGGDDVSDATNTADGSVVPPNRSNDGAAAADLGESDSSAETSADQAERDRVTNAADNDADPSPQPTVPTGQEASTPNDIDDSSAPRDATSKPVPTRRYDAAEMKLIGLGGRDRDGLCLWSTGSNAVVEHDFPHKGDYLLRASAFEGHVGDESAEMVMTIDGAAVAHFNVDAVRDAPGIYAARVKVEAGRHQIGLLYRNDVRTDEGDRNLFVTNLEIAPVAADDAMQPTAVARQPVPAKEARDAALAQIKIVFGEDYDGARTPEELLALAVKLRDLSGQLRAEPAARFVVISEAWRLGREAGDADVAISALDELAAEYDIDAWDLRTKTLTAILRNAKSPDARTAAARRALDLSERAIDADRFADAEDFAKTALAATSRARDVESRDMRTRATELIRTIKSLEKQWKDVQSALNTLKTDADDAAANLTLGKYLCFAKGDWPQGLVHLSKSGNARFAAIATAEQLAPADANDTMKLGDAWWDIGADAAHFEKKPVVARACHWYRRSLSAGVTGLERKRVEKRLQESDTTYQAFNADLVGHWTFDDDTPTSVRDAIGKRNGRVIGKVASNSQGRLGSALVLGGHGYVSFEEMDFGDHFTIALWAKFDETDGVQCLVTNRRDGNVTAGFTLRANDNHDTTRRLSFDTANGVAKHWLDRSEAIQFGQWHHIAVAVSRTDGTGFLYLDGKPLAESRTVRNDFPTRAAWQIGYYGQDSMKGQMDDLRIYRRMLTADEIAVLSGM